MYRKVVLKKKREFISDRHGSEVQNYYILKFFFLTKNRHGLLELYPKIHAVYFAKFRDLPSI
jgi:hypothetical protein